MNIVVFLLLGSIAAITFGVLWMRTRSVQRQNRIFHSISAAVFDLLRGFSVGNFVVRLHVESMQLHVHANVDSLAEFESALRTRLEKEEFKTNLTVTKLVGSPIGPTDTPGTRAAAWNGDVICWTTARGEKYFARGWVPPKKRVIKLAENACAESESRHSDKITTH